MPIPYTVFVDGSDLLPEHVNELFSAPKYDGQTQYLNHYPQLADASLDPNGVLKRVAAMIDPFKVQIESGISIRILGGSFRTEDDLLIVLPDEIITLPDNTTSFVYKDTAGTTAHNPSLPAIPKKRVLLARVTTASGAISAIVDYRGYDQRAVGVNPRSVRLFGGSSAVNKTPVDGETIGGMNYFRTFTVTAGRTIYIDKFAVINCQDFICDGQIIVLAAADSFTPPTYNVGKSSVITVANGTGLGTTGDVYNYLMQPYGSAGQSGAILNNDTVNNMTSVSSAKGGKGGGGLQINASNIIAFGSASVLTANGTNATNPAVNSGSTNWGVSGGGGGSGGTILLNALNTVTIAPGAVVNLRGGNGSTAFTSGGANKALGGCSGAGGFLFASSPTLPNFTGATVNLQAGTPGTSVGAEASDLQSGAGGGNATFGGVATGNSVATRTGQAGILVVSNNVPNG